MSLNVVRSLSDDQVEQLCALYQRQWWSTGRNEADVCEMLAHCEIAALIEGDELVAFARAVTDCVYKALVLDVIVAETRRGEGLGRRIMDAIADHPNLRNVRHFELYCRTDMAPFYAQLGYESELGDLQLMRYCRSQ